RATLERQAARRWSRPRTMSASFKLDGLERRPAMVAGRVRKGKRPPIQISGRLAWWSGAESNRRHTDFQSVALPTELPDPLRVTPGSGCRSYMFGPQI